MDARRQVENVNVLSWCNANGVATYPKVSTHYLFFGPITETKLQEVRVIAFSLVPSLRHHQTRRVRAATILSKKSDRLSVDDLDA
jgi:hypothetical protein